MHEIFGNFFSETLRFYLLHNRNRVFCVWRVYFDYDESSYNRLSLSSMAFRLLSKVVLGM